MKGEVLFKVKDIMSKDVITVKPTTPILEAVKILVEQNISGLPVVSDDMQLLGIVTEKDLLNLLYNPSNEYQSVSDLMSEDVICFNENDDLIKVCERLLKSSFRRVPILAKGKLVGVVSRRDLIKFILKVRH